MIEVRMLRAGDGNILMRAVPDLFDHPLKREWAREFLADPRHHIGVAMVDGAVVGFASAVHYIHPDKPAELWINEVAVAPPHRKRGLARRIMQAVFVHGRELGCKVAWVLTETDNQAARALYASTGGRELSRDTVHVEFAL